MFKAWARCEMYRFIFLMWQAGPNESPQTGMSVALAKTPGGLLRVLPTPSFEAEGASEDGAMKALPRKL